MTLLFKKIMETKREKFILLNQRKTLKNEL